MTLSDSDISYKYSNTVAGIFIERPNRFIARVLVDGAEETVHVKNTGRCRELLVKGARVILEKSSNPDRKTAWDLIAVYKGNLLINMDSQVPNAVAALWIKNGGLGFIPSQLKREVSHGDSRFDIFAAREDGSPCFIEVKGVTLEDKGVLRFPDAPTQRGKKHVQGLIRAVKEGYSCWVLFVIQMEGALYFEANTGTDPEFAQSLKEAMDAGVNILAVQCHVEEDSLYITDQVPVRL